MELGHFVTRSGVTCLEEMNYLRKTAPAHRTATYRVWRYQILYNTIWPSDDEYNSARNM